MAVEQAVRGRWSRVKQIERLGVSSHPGANKGKRVSGPRGELRHTLSACSFTSLAWKDVGFAELLRLCCNWNEYITQIGKVSSAMWSRVERSRNATKNHQLGDTGNGKGPGYAHGLPPDISSSSRSSYSMGHMVSGNRLGMKLLLCVNLVGVFWQQAHQPQYSLMVPP